MAEKKAKVETVKLGDSIELDDPANYVRLPGGSVVTASKHYVVRHEGEHQAGERKFVGKKD